MDSVIPDVNGVNVRVGASLPHAEKKTIKAVHGPTETVIYERIHEAYARRRARPRDRRDAPEYSAPSPAVPRIVANHAFSQTFGQSTSVSMIISPGIYTLCGVSTCSARYVTEETTFISVQTGQITVALRLRIPWHRPTDGNILFRMPPQLQQPVIRRLGEGES
ncbi:MAG: hypothetical protein Q9206_005044 [Seirophora lacunosa]